MLSSVTILLCWVKIIVHFRARPEVAFIILMLAAVFNDMKYFLYILLWILLGFTFSCKFNFT